MSADNWGFCPNCMKQAGENVSAISQDLIDQYGIISVAEYIALQEAREAAQYDYENLEETLREDYEIGINSDGEFRVDYSAGCKTCDWKFHFEERKLVI